MTRLNRVLAFLHFPRQGKKKKQKSLMTEHIFEIFFQSPHSNRLLRPVQEVLIYDFFNFTIQGQIGLLKNAPTWPRSFTLRGK